VLNTRSFDGRILVQPTGDVKLFFLPIDQLWSQGYYQLARRIQRSKHRSHIGFDETLPVSEQIDSSLRKWRPKSWILAEFLDWPTSRIGMSKSA